MLEAIPRKEKNPPNCSRQSPENIAKDNKVQKRKKGVDPDSETCIIDCDSNTTHLRWNRGLSPSISKNRCQGHWIASKNRRMNPNEMLRLQGMNPDNLKLNVSDKEKGELIGNEMSANVIERILLRV